MVASAVYSAPQVNFVGVSSLHAFGWILALSSGWITLVLLIDNHIIMDVVCFGSANKGHDFLIQRFSTVYCYLYK